MREVYPCRVPIWVPRRLLCGIVAWQNNSQDNERKGSFLPNQNQRFRITNEYNIFSSFMDIVGQLFLNHHPGNPTQIPCLCLFVEIGMDNDREVYTSTWLASYQHC